MSAELSMEGKAPVLDINAKRPFDDCASEIAGTVIEIDPAREAAARRKFDIYVLPVSVIFLVLSSLDRNNVSQPIVLPVSHS